MKKLTLLIFSVVFLTEAVNAQKEQAWKFGLDARPFLSWFKIENNSDQIDDIKSDGSKPGFAYGLNSEYHFSDNYALQIDIHHVLTGSNYKKTLGDSSVTRKWNELQYVEIPVTLKMMTNEIGYWTYYAKIGFNPGFNIKSRGDQTKGDETDNDRQFNSATFHSGIVVGAGAMYSLGGTTYAKGGLILNNGFSTIDKADNYEIRRISIGLDFGLIF